MLPLVSTIEPCLRRDSSARVLHKPADMCRTLCLLLLVVTANLLPTRTAKACKCSEIQPRVLIPTPGSSLCWGDPILVGAAQGVTPFLYDPSGNLVDLQLSKQGTALSSCMGQYLLYRPSASSFGTSGEFTLLLADDMSPSVVNTFTMALDCDRPEIAVSADVNLSRSQVEPYVSGSGMCDPIFIDGATVDGFVEYTVTLSRAAPVFVEAWYDDPWLGRIQDFRSTVPIVAAVAAADVTSKTRIELLHVQGSGDCVDVRLYTWTFQTVWSERVCFTDSESRSFDVKFDMPEWNLLDTAAVAPPPPRYTAPGCVASPRPKRGGSWPVFLLTFASLGRRPCRTRKNCSANSSPSP